MYINFFLSICRCCGKRCKCRVQEVGHTKPGTSGECNQTGTVAVWIVSDPHPSGLAVWVVSDPHPSGLACMAVGYTHTCSSMFMLKSADGGRMFILCIFQWFSGIFYSEKLSTRAEGGLV